VAGPFKIESKALTIASEADNGKVEDTPNNSQTGVLATTKGDSSAGGNWIPVSIVVIIAAAATGLATRRKKAKA